MEDVVPIPNCMLRLELWALPSCPAPPRQLLQCRGLGSRKRGAAEEAANTVTSRLETLLPPGASVS